MNYAGSILLLVFSLGLVLWWSGWLLLLLAILLSPAALAAWACAQLRRGLETNHESN